MVFQFHSTNSTILPSGSLTIAMRTARCIEGKDGAAAILELHPSTLRARMHKLGMVWPETKEPD